MAALREAQFLHQNKLKAHVVSLSKKVGFLVVKW